MKKKQNGFVIELMLVFMLITFGFAMAVTAFLSSLSVERKYADRFVDMQTDLNQIGEYYLRSIEAGKNFPNGSEESFESFDWMDEDAKAFFAKCKEQYGFKYSTYFSITREGLLKFFQDKFIWRKLVISADGANKMVVELKETRIPEENNKTEYYIKSWTVGDNITDEETAGGYKVDNLNILQKLWKFIGLQINSIDELIVNNDWYGFFIENFREAFLND